MRLGGILAVVVATLATGCVDDAAPAHIPGAIEVDIEPRHSASPTHSPRAADAPRASAAAVPVLDGNTRLRFSGVCEEVCRFRFDNRFVGDDSWIEARVAWDGTAVAALNLTLAGPHGDVPGQVGFDAARSLAWSPVAGEWEVRVRGAGAFTGWVQTFTSGGWRGDGATLLPNLVTLVPEEVALSGCLPEEQAEQGARRCLRLGNAIGNVGDGPLQVVLSIPDGGLAVAGQGHFVQRIFMADGTHRDEVVMGAQFHPTHGHFHYRGVAEFTLYEYDEQTGLRGDAVAATKKSGFCLLDIGQMRGPDVPTEEGGRYAEQDCLVPLSTDGWTMGVSRGWYDYYTAGLADQYVDVASVPDGVYELVSVADAPQSLAESDETDNAASVIVRLADDHVDVLGSRGFYRL